MVNLLLQAVERSVSPAVVVGSMPSTALDSNTFLENVHAALYDTVKILYRNDMFFAQLRRAIISS